MAEIDGETGRRCWYTMVDSPVGTLTLVATDAGLAAVLWEQQPRAASETAHRGTENSSHPVLVQTSRELGEYFARERKQFSVTLDVVGTVFQRLVWNALLTIPFGETRSYGQIATCRSGQTHKAVRAVGAANGRNPVSIIAPCHRVVGAAGSLTGFSGGLGIKAHLLALEGSRLPAVL